MLKEKKRSTKKINICEVGHKTHKTKKVVIDLSKHKVFSYPRINPSFTIDKRFSFEVFDYNRYEDTKGYCTGKDEVSNSILENGIWEGFETLLVLDILNYHTIDEDVVIDFGTHVGWFSLLAAFVCQSKVVGFEADAENIKVLKRNMRANKVPNTRYKINHKWVDQEMDELDIKHPIALVKCDIEGKEIFAVNALHEQFSRGSISYALVEVTPVFEQKWHESFREGYVKNDIVAKLEQYGYKAYMVPEKGFEHMEEYAENPLHTLKKYCCFDHKYTFDQANILFVRGDLV